MASGTFEDIGDQFRDAVGIVHFTCNNEFNCSLLAGGDHVQYCSQALIFQSSGMIGQREGRGRLGFVVSPNLRRRWK